MVSFLSLISINYLICYLINYNFFLDCVFEGKNCELILNVENGFIVRESKNLDIILEKDFSELVSSSDDNARFVTLKFKNENFSRDFDMLKQPKPFTFCLHSFLFVKLSKTGII